jgi:hypothetical protein
MHIQRSIEVYFVVSELFARDVRVCVCVFLVVDETNKLYYRIFPLDACSCPNIYAGRWGLSCSSHVQEIYSSRQFRLLKYSATFFPVSLHAWRSFSKP